jgi:drug/metabolite transporter (DMT)-like permease
VGLGLLFVEPIRAAAAGPDRLWGDAAFVAGAVAWSAYTLLGKAAAGRFSPLASATYAAVLGLPVMALAAGPAWATTAWSSLSPTFWGAIAFMAVGCTVVAFALFLDAIRRIGAAATAIWLLLIPVFGVALAAAMLGERPQALQVLGMAITALAVWLAQRPAVPVPAPSLDR